MGETFQELLPNVEAIDSVTAKTVSSWNRNEGIKCVHNQDFEVYHDYRPDPRNIPPPNMHQISSKLKHGQQWGHDCIDQYAVL